MVKHLLPKELEVLEGEFRKRGCDPKDYLSYDKKVAATKEDEQLDVTAEQAERLGVDKDWLRAQTTAIKNEATEIWDLERATTKSTRRLKEHTASRILAKLNSGNTSRRLDELKKMKELSDIGLGVPKFSRGTTDQLVSDPHGDPTERKWVEAVNAARNDAFKHPYMCTLPSVSSKKPDQKRCLSSLSRFQERWPCLRKADLIRTKLGENSTNNPKKR
ncbi:unnamed protein product [Caenorhabditis brenneri]